MHFLSISPFRFAEAFDAMPDYIARGIYAADVSPFFFQAAIARLPMP
jgi:hypothetical protein